MAMSKLFFPCRALPSKQLLSRCTLYGVGGDWGRFCSRSRTDWLMLFCVHAERSGRAAAVYRGRQRDGLVLKWIGNLPSTPDAQVAWPRLCLIPQFNETHRYAGTFWPWQITKYSWQIDSNFVFCNFKSFKGHSHEAQMVSSSIKFVLISLFSLP